MMELISLEPKTQVAGVTMIMDANGYGYKHFTAISMTDMKMSFKLMEVGGPSTLFLLFYVIHLKLMTAEWISIMVPCHACTECSSISNNNVQFNEAILGGTNKGMTFISRCELFLLFNV